MAAFVAKKVVKRITKTKKTTEEEAPPATNLNIKFGKPVKQITYGTIKTLGALTAALLIGITIFSFKLFSSAITIRNTLGQFINMVSKGDGEILSSLQALPVLIFILLDLALMYVVYKIFSPEERPTMNWLLYLLLMVSLALICIIFILMIVIMAHIYGKHEELHNGIVEAMKNYSTNSVYKMQMDRLQIEFQCCGSKKYDEWYNITWYDTSLAKKGASPELNLSISTHGCYSRLREKKQEVGWGIIGNLFLYIILQAGLVSCLRFLQTAHFETSKFEGHSRLYTIWLFGCYVGKLKVKKTPPEPPPVPMELMD